MVELRPYQQDLLNRAEMGLAAPDSRVMVQLPTGGGKTRIAAALLAGWVRGGKAAWLTHRKELADQTCLVLNDSGVRATSRPKWGTADPAPVMRDGVVILMVQTVSHRNHEDLRLIEGVWEAYGPNDLLVIDEAHHATAPGYERAINQWPGRVVGLTATPWRLEKDKGFDHLFGELYCGPQVRQLQAGDYLCEARVWRPTQEDIIRGGGIRAGEYTPTGIEQANSDRVMTAGALRFWQDYASERQTIIYAVSTGHANNLTTVFNDAGIPAAVMLTGTPQEERAKAIESFKNGTLQVLVNVAVATEGFDLPNASCVVLTRPTMSLALYLQMVGRGLRPKADGGDCLILDLAGNYEMHGFPEDDHPWSLLPRGTNSGGNAPGVWCEKCNGVSPAASHDCKHCEVSLGKKCGRCVKWRATKRWMLADGCGHIHEIVCDLCHLDAHVEANLPENRELRDSAVDPLLFTLVDEIRRRVLVDNDARHKELSELIDQRTQENSNDADLDHLFDAYISSLSVEERPTSNRAIAIEFNSWEIQRREELNGWIQERVRLESRSTSEDKVRGECREQIERAGSRNLSEGISQALKADELGAFAEEMSQGFKHLLLRLDDEECERTYSQSERDELDDYDRKIGAKTNTREDDHRFRQLNGRLNQAKDRRLRTIKRQFERHWSEIWADYQQSPERR